MNINTPEIPLTAADLHPGDVLLSTSNRWQSWLIRWLDGGGFSDAGLYDGEQVVMSGVNGIERRPLYTADVFRFHHEGRPLGDGELNPDILLDQARLYLQTPNLYGYEPLYLVGMLMIMRRLARPAWRRTLVEALGGVLLARIRQSMERHFPSGVVAVTCSELVTRIFCDARRVSRLPFDIMIELEGRHRRRAWPPTSGRFEHLMQQIEEVLSRVNPDLPIAASRARSAAPGSFGMAVVAGGPLAPACFVSPGDLQHSASFVHMGRVAAEPPGGQLTSPERAALATRDGARAPHAETR